MACRIADAEPLGIIAAGASRIVQVSDAQIAEAMRILFSDTHNVGEGAGVAGLAAALSERERIAGKSVAVVLSGGNVDRDVFGEVLTEVA